MCSIVWRAKRNKNQSAALHTLSRNIATSTPQYYVLGNTTSSDSYPVVIQGPCPESIKISDSAYYRDEISKAAAPVADDPYLVRMSGKHMVGRVDRRGQWKRDARGLCKTSRSIMKSVFRRLRLICCTYESFKYQDVQIHVYGDFCVDRRTEPITLPIAHARGAIRTHCIVTSLRRSLPGHIWPISCAHERRGHGCMHYASNRLPVDRRGYQKALFVTLMDRVSWFQAHWSQFFAEFDWFIVLTSCSDAYTSKSADFCANNDATECFTPSACAQGNYPVL
jgi:hypothetical protein